MTLIEKTRYYFDFLEYYKKAERQQELCNLGIVPHAHSGVGDSLMENVELYDVVERKYAGFSQIVHDVLYGWTPEHPYFLKMEGGYATEERMRVTRLWTGKQLEEADWIYLFLLHRVTGSAINYAKIPSGYHNTLLFHLHECDNIEEMTQVVRTHDKPFYTSVGYQFPAFPKPAEGYKRGGDYYLCEFAPELARSFTNWVRTGKPKKFREMGDWLFDWNVRHGLRKYKFQYAAFIADIADWFPEYVDRESFFYYGTNAIECISYLAKPKQKMPKEAFLDEVMSEIYRETGSLPYNAEDVCCDYIRYVENYIKPGLHYDHLDRDVIWNSSSITDHPFGRQKAMLELGLIDSFNALNSHPSDDYVLSYAGIDRDEYHRRLHRSRGHRPQHSNRIER
jgi:hypothetical protein